MWIIAYACAFLHLSDPEDYSTYVQDSQLNDQLSFYW